MNTYTPIAYSGLDWSMILYFVSILLVLVSVGLSIAVKSVFNKYAQVKNARGITGAQAAQFILEQNGVYDVQIGQVGGSLTDHYSPNAKTLNLSEAVFSKPSVASVAVAAHECGHAIQHAQAYLPLRIRTAIVPVANLGSRAGFFIFFIGLAIARTQILMDLGILLFAAAVVFHIITLPVEFNASRRGLQALTQTGILYGEEMTGARKVLTIAALTYVASAAAAAVQLLRLIAIRNRD